MGVERRWSRMGWIQGGDGVEWIGVKQGGVEWSG